MTLTSKVNKNESRYLILIAVLGIAIPIVVALLLFMPQTGKLGDLDFSFLPHLNAVLNSATAIALVMGYYLIKTGARQAHKTSMLIAFGLSSLFLVSYVLYHFQEASTMYGDLDHNGIVTEVEKAAAGISRIIYLCLLLSHIVMAAIIVPFVLLSVYFGLSNQLERHKKISKYTLPMWLYAEVTGVIVYLMISPYYQ
jgi:putative membrane protein